VSRHSTASDYIVDKEIAIIRRRQANGEEVHFYPLLLTPTPKAGLDLVRDKNLRPRDGKPLSSYSLHDRQQHMSDAADEIAAIAAKTMEHQNRSAPPTRTNKTSLARGGSRSRRDYVPHRREPEGAGERERELH
jgi:hypothetical protein